MSDPLLSLVTGTVNREASLKRLVHSIVERTTVSWECVIADASDTPIDETSFPANVRVIPDRPRSTCTQGYNRAFHATRGQWVLFLNDDAEVMPGYAEAAIEFMKAHDHIGLGALHYSEDGGPYHVNSAWNCIYANFGILSRAIGEHVGWFDTDLDMYGCDNSLTFRVLLAGHGVADIPDARIRHHSEKDEVRTANQASRLRDNETLHDKYWPLRDQWLSTYQRLRIPNETLAWSHGRKP
jgi:GT2 family glycosyltransferase